MQLPGRQVSRRAGFTLIELLAVLLILTILIAVLVTNLMPAREVAEARTTKVLMGQISATLHELSNDTGDFPRSQLQSELGASNPLNVGAECLYLGLCAQGAPGFGVLDKDLCNTDGDSLSKRPKGFEVQDLFEIADAWNNPIAYIHHSDYEREFRYVTMDQEGQEEEFTVRAAKNDKTGRFHEPHGFQLISAGVDGKFATEDDIVLFKK